MVGYNALNLNMTAGAAITVGNVVEISAANTVVVGTAADTKVMGVARSTGVSGEPITVQVDGVVKVVSALEVVAGDLMIGAASGQVTPILSGTFDQRIGKSLTTYTIPVAQVDTITIGGTFDADDVFTTVIDGISTDYTAVVGDTNNEGIIDAIVLALLAVPAVVAIVTPVKASATTMTLTAVTAGTAFTATASEVDGGGTDDQTWVRGATTANTAAVGTSTIDLLLKIN